MEALQVAPLSAEQAAPRLARVTDPTGHDTPATLAAGGHAFELTTAGGRGVFVLSRNGEQLWIDAAQGEASDDLTAQGLAVIEQTAKQAGCAEVGFSTARPGLVRKAQRAGYTVAGFILRKKV